MAEVQHNADLEAPNWKDVADVLAAELKRWGWGDFHYGLDGKQEESVVNALAVYYRAAHIDGSLTPAQAAEIDSGGMDHFR